MQKIFTLLCTFALAVMLTACDDSDSEDVTEIIPGDDSSTYPELVELEGTTWVKQEYTYIIEEITTDSSSSPVITTGRNIPLKQATTTLIFHSDGSFTITYEHVYLPAWDNIYVDNGNTWYMPQHLSTAPLGYAFSGYAGNYCNLDSHFVKNGSWKKVLVPSLMDNEDMYTWDYQIKFEESYFEQYTIDEGSATYSVLSAAQSTYTYIDDNSTWIEDAIEIVNVSVDGDTDGLEVTFNINLSLSISVSGTYTRQ